MSKARKAETYRAARRNAWHREPKATRGPWPNITQDRREIAGEARPRYRLNRETGLPVLVNVPWPTSKYAPHQGKRECARRRTSP